MNLEVKVPFNVSIEILCDDDLDFLRNLNHHLVLSSYYKNDFIYIKAELLNVKNIFDLTASEFSLFKDIDLNNPVHNMLHNNFNYNLFKITVPFMNYNTKNITQSINEQSLYYCKLYLESKNILVMGKSFS